VGTYFEALLILERFFSDKVVVKSHYQYDSYLVFSVENLSVEDIAILSDDLLETPSSHSANPLLFYHSIALHLVLVVALAATIELGVHQGVMIRTPDFFFFGFKNASAA
jgi:hypothetical protein